MPELTWVGKDKVITHHLDVPLRVLDRKYSFDEVGQSERACQLVCVSGVVTGRG